MPRGSKLCKSCGATNGPRAFICSSCNKPFEIKGKAVTAEKIEEAKNRRAGVPVSTPSRDPDTDENGFHYELTDFFVRVPPTPTELKNNGKNVTCWMSKDNKFRLRMSKEFMGVDITHLHDKPYVLLKRDDQRGSQVVWQLVRRFSRWTAATKYYHDVTSGIKELVLYRPGDDDRRSHVSRRVAKRNKKIAKAKTKSK